MTARRGLHVEDWRHAPEGVIRRLFAIETERWSSLLEWETAANWAEVERGRRLGTVRGVLVTDAFHNVVGWSFYLVHDRVLQVGGFSSASEETTRLLLDFVLHSQTLEEVDAVTFFAFTDAEGVAAALRQRGLAVGRYWYLSRDVPLPGGAALIRETRGWLPGDAQATADLLHRAYGPSDGSRPFVPKGTRDEWEKYVAQLVLANGCGTLLPEASLCVPAGPGRLAAVALISRIAPGTGHLVQLAVDPQFQRRGYATSLLTGVGAAAARAGCRRLTLFVEGRNARARAVYDDAGFMAMGSFVAAGTLQPRRSTSVAPVARATTFR